jgi:hypothetical protein
MTNQATTRSRSPLPRGAGATSTIRRREHPRSRHVDQPVLAIRASIDERDAARFVHDALEEIHVFMHGRGLRPAGPPFTIVNRAKETGTVDVEAGWPIDRPVAGADRIHGGMLPTAIAGHCGRLPLVDDGADPTDLF